MKISNPDITELLPDSSQGQKINWRTQRIYSLTPVLLTSHQGDG